MLTVGVDGSALGNPGPAGWAWYIDDSNWAAGGWEESTNNRGELSAIIQLLEATRATDHDLTILADSQYAINSITKWMAGWKRKNWKKSDGKPVINKDLMIQLDELMTEAKDSGRSITYQWIKGHAGHPLNEAADTRANGAAKAFQTGKPVDSGPGLTLDSGDLEDATEGDPDRSTEQTIDLITVHTPIDRKMANIIVQRSKQRGVTPNQELAMLIELGMQKAYNEPS